MAIVGHVDEIGLIVHHIDDDGFLWFSGVGGWGRVAPGSPGNRTNRNSEAGRPVDLDW